MLQQGMEYMYNRACSDLWLGIHVTGHAWICGIEYMSQDMFKSLAWKTCYGACLDPRHGIHVTGHGGMEYMLQGMLGSVV